MAAYTLLQLVETALFGVVLMYGLLSHRPSIAVLGGGFLIGKAVLNILAPEGGSIRRRSVIGYSIGAIYVLFGVAAVHFLA